MTARVPNTPIVALRRILNAYADSLRQLGLKIAHGILWRSVHPYLKVQMRTCRITGSAHAADLLPLRDGLSFRHQQSGLVPIQGNQTVAMRDHDGLPISSPPTSKHNRPRVRRLDYSPPGYGDIQSGVHLTHAGNGMRPVAEAGTHPPSDRPDQLPVPWAETPWLSIARSSSSILRDSTAKSCSRFSQISLSSAAFLARACFSARA